MSTAAVAPLAGACREYQGLLDSCQRSLAAWQQRRSLAQRDPLVSQRLRAQLQRLQEEYVRAYALLESHEKFCQTCQYISKVGGLDFESLSNALTRRHDF